MTNKLRKNLILVIISLMCACVLGLCLNTGTTSKVKAEESTTEELKSFNLTLQYYKDLCKEQDGAYLDYEITIDNIDYFDETLLDNYVIRQENFPILTESNVISKYQNKETPYIDIFGTIYVFDENYCYIINGEQVEKLDMLTEKVKYIEYTSAISYGSYATYFRFNIPTEEFDIHNQTGVKLGGADYTHHFEYIEAENIIYDDYTLQEGDITFGDIELFNNATQNCFELWKNSVKVSFRNEYLYARFKFIDTNFSAIINGEETQLVTRRAKDYYTFSGQDFDTIQLKGTTNNYTFYSQPFQLVELYKDMVDSDFSIGLGPELNDLQKSIIKMKANAYETALDKQIALCQDNFVDVDVLNPEQYVGGNYIFKIPKKIEDSYFTLHYYAGGAEFKINYSSGSYSFSSAVLEIKWSTGVGLYSLAEDEEYGATSRPLIREIVSCFDMFEDENYIYIKTGGTYKIISFIINNASGDFGFSMCNFSSPEWYHVQVLKYVLDEDFLDEIQELQNQIIDLKNQASNLNTTNQSQVQEILSLEESIANLENAYNTLNERYTTLNNKYLNALTENEELKTEKNQAIENYLDEIEAHKATKATLETQIAEKNGNIEELTAELAEVNATLAEKEQELVTLQEEYSVLERQYEELDAEYQAFLEGAGGELDAVATLLHDYKLQVARLEKEVKELTEERDQLESELEKEKEQPKGCQSSGCSAGGGSSGGIGSGLNSTLLSTGLGITLFGVMLYVKRKKVKE